MSDAISKISSEDITLKAECVVFPPTKCCAANAGVAVGKTMQPGDHILSQMVWMRYVFPVPAFPSINIRRDWFSTTAVMIRS
jgi:hypothetical protein